MPSTKPLRAYDEEEPQRQPQQKPAIASNNATLNLVKKVLRHMGSMSEGHQVGGILLAGDPGIGKTSFVTMLGSLLGMKTIVIEVPHVTEEHLINIPFLVFNPQTGTSQTLNSQMSSDYKLVLAQSNLYTQMTSVQPMTDEAYLQHIQKAPAFVQQLFLALGGSPTSIPEAIQEVRDQHKSILFLDEFYRETTTRIRNIMRGILNGNIGLHKIPASVYIMYASNMKDTGLEQIPSNHQFTVIEHRTPTKGDWFDWLVASYERESDVNLNDSVINKFKQILKDEHISAVDAEEDVRTSPRRWEQLLLYISTSLPTKDYATARTLLSNVKNNFINYQTGKHSKLHKSVIDAVAELIEETSKIKIASSDTLEPHEWRQSLLHAVEQQMKGGERRKYIPVVSGPPGIGKTTQAAAVARAHNLRLIEIDVSEIYADDAIGMPLPGERTGDNITVKFSLPKLYHQIMNIIKEKDETYKTWLRETAGPEAEQKVKEYEQQRWKYLIFFDEINRVDEKTFNSLRKVILEKNFGPSGGKDGELLKLPKEAVVVAAMNPEGVGTSELTQHFRDVIDVIPAQANWADTKAWLMAKTFKKVPPNTKEVAMNIMEEFVRKFMSKDAQKHNPKQAPFNLDIGGIELYVAPREYADMFATLVRELAYAIKNALSSDKSDKQIRAEVDDAVGDALEDSLNMIFYKHEVDKDEFMHTMKLWIKQLPESVFGGLLTKKASNVSTLSGALGQYLEGKDLISMPDDVQIVNANNNMNNAQFIEQVKSTLAGKIRDEETVRKFILDESQPKIALSGDNLVREPGTKVSLLANFMFATLYSMHLHNYSNDRLMAIGKSLSHMISELRKSLIAAKKLDDDTDDAMQEAQGELRAALHDVITEL